MTGESKPIRSGTAFRNGKCYSFSRSGVLVATQWPDLRAWRKTPKGKVWQQVRPALRVEKKAAGWDCQWEHRESRQPHGVAGDHIRYRLEEARRDREGRFQTVSLAEMDAGEQNRRTNDEEYLAREAWWKAVDERDQRLHAEYLRPIPEEILSAASAYPRRHWHLLNLAARCPGGLDLIHSTPALALAVSSPWVFRSIAPSHPWRAVRSLLRKNQTMIAEWLGFPAGWSAIKILRKLPPDQCTVLNLLNLRKLFQSHLKDLRHLPFLNGALIWLLSDEKDQYRLSSAFLQEITAEPGTLARAANILRDTLWMAKMLEERSVLKLRSYRHLIQAHDRMVTRIGCADLRIANAPPFPPAPLWTDHPLLKLEPLQTENDLLDEGSRQANCVGSYGPRVRRGKMYIYRLLEPERATISLCKTASGMWSLNEIKAYDNKEVRPETLATVLEWVESDVPF